MELIRKADGWMIKRLNNIYLWAMDWTGLYVGTVCFLLGAEQVFYMISRNSMWIAAFQFILVLAISAPRYYWQAMGMDKLLNTVAEQFEEWVSIRLFFVVWGLLMIPGHAMSKNWHGVVDDIVGVLLLYVWCFRIRDREKKTFNFSLKTATEGA